MRRRPKNKTADQPRSPQDDFEWGGERILAVDFTEGGAPIGSTESEFRTASSDRPRHAGWAIAKEALEIAASRFDPGARVEVDRVKRIGGGLSRDAHTAHVEFTPDPRALTGPYVALVFKGDQAEARSSAAREARLLRSLGEPLRTLRVPARAEAVDVAGRAVLVREMLEGIPFDQRAGRQQGVRPYEVVAQAAAAIHGVDLSGIDLPGFATRQEHAIAALRSFAGLQGPVIDAAVAWAQSHLPPPAPAVLVHGDLLGQNLLLNPCDDRIGVIDWEFAQRGDPAWDLAIVTRGVRRPFQLDDGLARLLDDYSRLGAAPIRAWDVRIYELCLAAAWYREALSGSHEPAAEALGRVKRILEMAKRES